MPDVATLQMAVQALAGAIAVAGALTAVVRRWRGAYRPLLVVECGLLTASAAMRWFAAGHPPMFGTYENTVTAALALAVTALAVDLRTRGGRIADAGRAVAVWVPVQIAYGAFFSTAAYPLTISERSLLVDVHVGFAWAAYALVALGSMVALGVVLPGRGGDDDADAAVVRTAGLGFLMLTVMMAVGAVYSWMLTADWYPWEMVGTLTAAAWLGYAAVLHARIMFGWRGRRLAWAMLAVLPVTVAAFWVWSIYAGTYHHFDIAVIRAF